MKKSSPLGDKHVQLDPNAFVADPVLLQALAGRSTPVPCESDGADAVSPAMALRFATEGQWRRVTDLER